MWPFGRKGKRKPKRKKKAKARPEERSLARERAEAMRQQRAAGHRRAARDAVQQVTKKRKKYVPPPVPDDPTELPLNYRAPEGAAIWHWVKQVPQDYFIEAWTEQDPEGFEDFSKWPRAELPRGIHAIRRHVLDLILEASKAQYPNEFGGMLRLEEGVLEELILAPGTEGGATAAIFQFHMMPVDMSVVGTIHSHPSPVPYPSAADTALFERHGRIHIITGYPFGPNDWRAFDHRSRLVPLKVVA